jgi:hypothetical protein
MLQVGYENRTGKVWRGHYDIWLRDEAVELARELGTQPAFPLPAELVTRTATNETFGIGPISEVDVAELGLRKATPVERLVDSRQIVSRLYTQRRQDRAIIAALQGTVKEVAPVALPAEFVLLNSTNCWPRACSIEIPSPNLPPSRR